MQKEANALKSLVLVMALLLGFSQAIWAATLFPNSSRGWNKIPTVVVSGKKGDLRIPLVIEAVDFWNKSCRKSAVGLGWGRLRSQKKPSRLRNCKPGVRLSFLSKGRWRQRQV